MPYPCRLVPRNVFDLATLTSTIAPYTTTPLINAQNPRRARVVRWPSAGGTQSIKGTWNGQGFVIGCIAIDRLNFFPDALVRFRAWANQDWTGTLLVDTGSVAAYNAAALGSFTWGVDPLGTSIYDGYLGYKYFVNWFAKQTVASFQIDITDTNNSFQYSEFSRGVVGDFLQTTYNVKFSAKSGWREKTVQDETDGGSLFSDGRVPRRFVSGTFPALTDAERQALYDLVRFNGKRKAFLAAFQAGEGASFERDFTIPQAKFVELPEAEYLIPGAHGVPSFDVIEA